MWLSGIFMMTNLLSMLGSVFVCDIHADADPDKDEVGEDGVIPVRRETHEEKCPQCTCTQQALYCRKVVRFLEGI